jgi:hypothetical protein
MAATLHVARGSSRATKRTPGSAGGIEIPEALNMTLRTSKRTTADATWQPKDRVNPFVESGCISWNLAPDREIDRRRGFLPSLLGHSQ